MYHLRSVLRMELIEEALIVPIYATYSSLRTTPISVYLPWWLWLKFIITPWSAYISSLLCKNVRCVWGRHGTTRNNNLAFIDEILFLASVVSRMGTKVLQFCNLVYTLYTEIGFNVSCKNNVLLFNSFGQIPEHFCRTRWAQTIRWKDDDLLFYN